FRSLTDRVRWQHSCRRYPKVYRRGYGQLSTKPTCPTNQTVREVLQASRGRLKGQCQVDRLQQTEMRVGLANNQRLGSSCGGPLPPICVRQRPGAYRSWLACFRWANDENLLGRCAPPSANAAPTARQSSPNNPPPTIQPCAASVCLTAQRR